MYKYCYSNLGVYAKDLYFCEFITSGDTGSCIKDGDK